MKSLTTRRWRDFLQSQDTQANQANTDEISGRKILSAKSNIVGVMRRDSG